MKKPTDISNQMQMNFLFQPARTQYTLTTHTNTCAAPPCPIIRTLLTFSPFGKTRRQQRRQYQPFPSRCYFIWLFRIFKINGINESTKMMNRFSLQKGASTTEFSPIFRNKSDLFYSNADKNIKATIWREKITNSLKL